MKLELEKTREEQQQHQQQQPPEQQLVTNGNGYHGDSSLVQQQQQPNLQFPLMSGTPHIPIMHLQNAGDTDLHLDEDEEEEEEDDEEDEEEDEDDEAYEEDEDGSSVCSGLSDCSTHSLETIDPEDGEEDEEDEEDEEEEEEEEEDEEEEDDWDCLINGTSPPPYSVPLPSVLSYSNNTLMSLSSPFHNTPAFLSESVTVTPTLPTVETALKSEINTQLHCQTFPEPTESLTPQTRSHVDTRETNTAPAGVGNKQPLSTDLQNNPGDHDSQTEASAGSVEMRETAQEQLGLQTQEALPDPTDTSCSDCVWLFKCFREGSGDVWKSLFKNCDLQPLEFDLFLISALPKREWLPQILTQKAQRGDLILAQFVSKPF